MTHNDGCPRRRRVALGLLTIWLSGRATGASDGGGVGARPPVVEYSGRLQPRAAAELVLLPDRSAISETLADYAAMRARAWVCSLLETRS